VLRTLTLEAPHLGVGRSHRKLTAWNNDHLRAIGTITEDLSGRGWYFLSTHNAHEGHAQRSQGDEKCCHVRIHLADHSSQRWWLQTGPHNLADLRHQSFSCLQRRPAARVVLQETREPDARLGAVLVGLQIASSYLTLSSLRALTAGLSRNRRGRNSASS